MSNLVAYIFQDNQIRFVDGKPVANDIARALGYAKPTEVVNKRVSKDNKGVAELQTPGGRQSMMVLEEPGIYQLIFGSRLPSAILFQNWIFQEVLPEIRKTGSYSIKKGYVAEAISLDNELTEIDNTVERNLKAIKYTLGVMNALNSTMFESAVLAQFEINAVLKIDPNLQPLLEERKQYLINATATELKLYTVTELAKQLNISAVALNKLLVEKGLQTKVINPSKTQSKFNPTELGKQHSKFIQSVDTSGTTYSALRWQDTILPLIR